MAKREPNALVPGSRVRLRAEATGGSRPHLRAHALHGDVGTVVEPPTERVLWFRIRFDGCDHVHNVADNEIAR